MMYNKLKMVPFDLDESDVKKKKILPQLQHRYHSPHTQYTTFIN